MSSECSISRLMEAGVCSMLSVFVDVLSSLRMLCSFSNSIAFSSLHVVASLKLIAEDFKISR